VKKRGRRKKKGRRTSFRAGRDNLKGRPEEQGPEVRRGDAKITEEETEKKVRWFPDLKRLCKKGWGSEKKKKGDPTNAGSVMAGRKKRN